MSFCSTASLGRMGCFFGMNEMALARRLALRRSGFAWRFKDGSAPRARLSCLISDPCGIRRGRSQQGRWRAPAQARRSSPTSTAAPPNWLYETLHCARGQAENLIKLNEAQLASDRTSCRLALANQVRLVLHTAA